TERGAAVRGNHGRSVRGRRACAANAPTINARIHRAARASTPQADLPAMAVRPKKRGSPSRRPVRRASETLPAFRPPLERADQPTAGPANDGIREAHALPVASQESVSEAPLLGSPAPVPAEGGSLHTAAPRLLRA